MIVGSVNTHREAVVRIIVLDDLGRPHEFGAVVDTGFNGSLTLPPETIGDLNPAWRTRGSAILANGMMEECDIYSGIVMWDGQPQSILVEAAELPQL